MLLSQMDYPREAAVQEDSSLLLEDSRRLKDDVFISQYAVGQKDAFRAVLKQKAQNAAVLKEEKVQLLGKASTETKGSADGEPRLALREVDPATTIAAATAATIATTAPLLKIQNELEAKVNSVSELLHKLQETDRQLQRVAKQQLNTKAQREKSRCHEGISELAKEMNTFMVQRIQHLEKLQEQQMNIQSHLISFAVSTGGFQHIPPPSSNLKAEQSGKPEQQFHTCRMPSCQEGLSPATGPPAQVHSSQCQSPGINTHKSPLKTPVPRRCAPEPVSKNVRNSKKENSGTEKENICKSTCKGERRLCEQILNSQEMPVRQTELSGKAMLNSNTMSCCSEGDRHPALHTESFPAFGSSFQNCNPVEKTMEKAGDLLQDLGQLRGETHDVLQSKNLAVASDLPEHLQLNKPSILHNVKVPTSILRDAERILRGVQNNKKILEENLEAVIRAKDGDALYAVVSGLTANRDVLEEIRIRKTVDEWIRAISVEIQAEMTINDLEQGKYDQKVPWMEAARNIKAIKTNKALKAKTQKTQGCLTKNPLSAAKSLQKQGEDNMSKQRFRTYFSSESLQRNEKRAAGPVSGSAVVQNADNLCQVFGKPAYQGHQSTLRKAPCLRFNSPFPKSKLQRPKVTEYARGSKVKSARAQTCSRTQKVVTSPGKWPPLYGLAQGNQCLLSPCRDVPALSDPRGGHLIPMAIPLGPTQISDFSLQPAGAAVDQPHPVTVTTSLPQATPKLPAEIKTPNVAVIEVRSEKKDPPQLCVQVLPNVDIDSISSDSVSVNHVLPSSEPALSPVDAVIQTPEDAHCEEEDMKFPGANFMDTTDVMQDQEEERDEIPEIFEPLLELNGQFEVDSPKYNGPLFPPVASTPQHSSDVLDELIQRRETVENRLINWVEQEIMAKVISGMYPVQKETQPDVSATESEGSETAASDTVQAAAGGGSQLCVDAGVPLDSQVVTRLVNEALSETVAAVLGTRQGQRAGPSQSVLPSTVTVMESLVPTPLPTPQATPPQTPPSEKELLPIETPESSLSLPETSGDVHEHEKMKEAGAEIPAVTGRTGTPVATPVITPPRTATPSSPASEQVSKAAEVESPKPTDPWDDAELPLEEEKPSPLTEEPFCPKAAEMSVANDEEPEALISPPWQSSARAFRALPCHLQAPAPGSPDSSGHSSQESSLTLAEGADRPISEGEVLFSYGQILAAREGGLSLPNLAESLTSTLQDANEMDYDPPSEGQIVRRMDKGYHRDPVLALLDKLNQAPVAAKGGIYHLQPQPAQSVHTNVLPSPDSGKDSDDSVGEVSEGQRLGLSGAPERILREHSVDMDHPAAWASESRPHQGLRFPSPGQLAQTGAEVLGDADSSLGPMLMAEVESQPVSGPVLQTAQLSCRVTSLSEDLSQEENQGAVQVGIVRSRVILVKRKCEGMQQEGEDAPPHLNSRVSVEKLLVTLPPVSRDDGTEGTSSGSSGTDTF